MTKNMPKDRAESILEEIEKRAIVPIPRWRFLLKWAGFWLLAAVALLAGGISLATSNSILFSHDFLVDHYYSSLFFSEHPVIGNIILSIPYAWLLLLALVILIAFYSVRNTKKGYQHSGKRFIAVFLFLSIVLSIGFNAAMIGEYTSDYFEKNFHGYRELVDSTEGQWSQPAKGFLGGRLIEYTKSSHRLVLRDFNGGLWHVDISQAKKSSKTSLVPGSYIKIHGHQSGTHTFSAQTLHDWYERYQK